MLKNIFCRLFGNSDSKETGSSQNKQYYKLLGLKPGASLEAVNKAYEEEKQKLNPEPFSYDVRLKRRMEELIAELDVAYQKVLEDFKDKK